MNEWRRRALQVAVAALWLAAAATVRCAEALVPVTLVKGLSHPWGLAFLPDFAQSGRMLVTERPGRLRIVTTRGEVGPPIGGTPEVDAHGQGGLLDVALDPKFAANGLVYWSYAEAGAGGNGTAVARGRLVADGLQGRLENVQVVFRQQPKVRSTAHRAIRRWRSQ